MIIPTRAINWAIVSFLSLTLSTSLKAQDFYLGKQDQMGWVYWLRQNTVQRIPSITTNPDCECYRVGVKLIRSHDKVVLKSDWVVCFGGLVEYRGDLIFVDSIQDRGDRAAYRRLLDLVFGIGNWEYR